VLESREFHGENSYNLSLMEKYSSVEKTLEGHLIPTITTATQLRLWGYTSYILAYLLHGADSFLRS
jgi:hypothetical protein